MAGPEASGRGHGPQTSKAQQIKRRMSDAFCSSSHLQSSSNSIDQATVILPVFKTPQPDNVCVGQSSAGPSTWQKSHPRHDDSPTAVPSRRSLNSQKWATEEQDSTEKTKESLASHLASDHAHALFPDVDSPFRDTADAVYRLLPYHVFQQPKEDLDFLIKDGKGKGKATEEDFKKEIGETKFALECHKRLDALEARFRSIRIRSGKRSVPDTQAVLLASLALDSERSEMTVLNHELRTARAELERREKEKRVAATSARAVYYGSAPSAPASSMPAQYYRSWPYAYTQAYGTPPHSSSTSTFSLSPARTDNHASMQSAIPVQLPVASLPALHALGIVPVPAASLPSDGHPQPPAVLRGSTSDGTMLSLEINVSLLQSAQMSGLAMVLNSLMSRNSATNAISGPSTAQPAFPSSNDQATT